MPDPRARARQLAAEALARGDPSGWFELLYTESQRDGTPISWVALAPNSYLLDWMRSRRSALRGRALVVGCGYGDDAQLLAEAGLAVTAFDVAPSAIARCRERFRPSSVEYEIADALDAPLESSGAFDFVFEAYTVQVLSGPARAACARAIGSFVAPGGILLVVARSRRPGDPEGSMPWPLTRAELDEFAASGLTLVSLLDVAEPGDPPVPRFVAEFRR